MLLSEDLSCGERNGIQNLGASKSRSWQVSQELACAVYTDLHYGGDVMLMMVAAMVMVCIAFHLFGAMFVCPGCVL